MFTALKACSILGCKNEAKPLASVRCGSGGQKCPGRYECSSPPSGGAGVCCGMFIRCNCFLIVFRAYENNLRIVNLGYHFLSYTCR